MIYALINLIEKLYPWNPQKKDHIGKNFFQRVKNRLIRLYQRFLMGEERRRYLRGLSGVSGASPKTTLDKATDTQPLIVSLTSMKNRLPWLHITLASLMRQSMKPDKIVLYLNKDVGKIPETVSAFCARGLEIIYLDGDDLRAYKKIIPSLSRFPNAMIVTADDDLMYPRDWLKKLYLAYRKEPMFIHCHRAHKIRKTPQGRVAAYLKWDLTSPNDQGPSPLLFATHGAGALLCSSLLPEEVLNRKMFQRLSPYADDVWLYAMARMHGTQVKKVAPDSPALLYSFAPNGRAVFHIDALEDKNLIQHYNDKQLTAVLDHYHLWDKMT